MKHWKMKDIINNILNSVLYYLKKNKSNSHRFQLEELPTDLLLSVIHLCYELHKVSGIA